MGNSVMAIIEMERFPQKVAERAAWVATRLGCSLELVLSDPTVAFLRDRFMMSAESQQISETVHQAQSEALDHIAGSLDAKGLDIRTSILRDRPAADAIIAKALAENPVMVVKGTTYHSAAERATFAYNDWDLIRELEFDLWLVKSEAWNTQPVIIAAVDPTHPKDSDTGLTGKVVTTARHIADKCSGNLLLLHTYERLSEVGTYAIYNFKPVEIPVEELEKRMLERSDQLLHELAADNGLSADAVHLLPGRTRDLLPAFAREQKADLVIMGAVARSGHKRRVLGSTAEQVLDHLPCDVLVVRPG